MKKDVLAQIKDILGITQEKFFDATLADGTQITIEGDAPVEGAAVFIVNADGSQTPAPDSDIQLPDGTVISVAAGVITKITPAAEMKAADAPADAPAGDFVSKEDFQKLADQVAQLQKDLDAMKTNMSEAEKAQTKMAEIIQVIGSAPSDKPIVKVEPAKFKKQTEKEIQIENKKEVVANLLKKINAPDNK